MRGKEGVLGTSSSMPTQLSFDENLTAPTKRTVPRPFSGTSTRDPTFKVGTLDAGAAPVPVVALIFVISLSLAPDARQCSRVFWFPSLFSLFFSWFSF